MTFLSELVDKLARSPQDIRAEHLREWAASIEGVVPISEVQPRGRYKVAGVIQNVRVDPREGNDSIEATIDDGSGRVRIKWLGRQKLSGIAIGAGLVVDGTVGQTPDQRLLILNPEYELVPEPEHG